MPNDKVEIKGHILAIVRNPQTGETRKYESRNLITSVGKIYYAKLAAGEALADPYDTFTKMFVSSTSVTPTISSTYTDYASYVPATWGATAFDGRATNYTAAGANTGAGTNVATYYHTWAVAEMTSVTLYQVGICRTNVPTHTELVSVGSFTTPFAVTASDTLTVFINHSFA